MYTPKGLKFGQILSKFAKLIAFMEGLQTRFAKGRNRVGANPLSCNSQARCKYRCAKQLKNQKELQVSQAWRLCPASGYRESLSLYFTWNWQFSQYSLPKQNKFCCFTLLTEHVVWGQQQSRSLSITVRAHMMRQLCGEGT